VASGENDVGDNVVIRIGGNKNGNDFMGMRGNGNDKSYSRQKLCAEWDTNGNTAVIGSPLFFTPFQYINDNVTGKLPLTYTHDMRKLPVNYRQRLLPVI